MLPKTLSLMLALACGLGAAQPFPLPMAICLRPGDAAMSVRILKGKRRAPKPVAAAFQNFVAQDFVALSQAIYAENAEVLDQADRMPDPSPSDYYGPLYVVKGPHHCEAWLLHCSGMRGASERYAALMYDENLERLGAGPILNQALAPLYFEKPCFFEDLEDNAQPRLAYECRWKKGGASGVLLRYFAIQKDLSLHEVFGYDRESRDEAAKSDSKIIKRRPGRITLRLNVKTPQGGQRSSRVTLNFKDYDPKKLGPFF